MTALKRLVNSTATYTLANVINSAIPFLLLPVLTRVLAPAEYGVVTMFATVVSVLTAFTGLSIHGAVSVRHFDADTDHPRRPHKQKSPVLRQGFSSMVAIRLRQRSRNGDRRHPLLRT